MVADPVGSGFVASFPRPGGNVTGFSTTEDSLGGKWLELLITLANACGRLRPQNLDNQIVDSLVFRSSDVGVTRHTARRN